MFCLVNDDDDVFFFFWLFRNLNFLSCVSWRRKEQTTMFVSS